jgi:hypothetical protein
MRSRLRDVYASGVHRPAEAQQHLAARVKMHFLTLLFNSPNLVPRGIIITIFITFTQGIYNYVPETNHVSRLCSVAAVLYYN